MKTKIEPSLGLGNVFCCVTFQNFCGPVGHKHGNPAAGWEVWAYSKAVSPRFKNLKEAKAWAEQNYDIKGWSKPSDSPYKQTYAIPA